MRDFTFLFLGFAIYVCGYLMGTRDAKKYLISEFMNKMGVLDSFLESFLKKYHRSTKTYSSRRLTRAI